MKKQFQLLSVLVVLSNPLHCAHRAVQPGNIVELPFQKQFEHFVDVTTEAIEHADPKSCDQHIRESLEATEDQRLTAPYPETTLVTRSQGLRCIRYLTQGPSLATLTLPKPINGFLVYLASKLSDPVFLAEQSEKVELVTILHNNIIFWVKQVDPTMLNQGVKAIHQVRPVKTDLV